MTGAKINWKGLSLAAAVVAVNFIVAVRVIGLSYTKFAWAGLAASYEPSEDSLPGGCGDEIDNDGDSLTDCEDSDCFGAPECSAPAPAVSRNGLVAVILLLSALGFYALRRRRGEGKT